MGWLQSVGSISLYVSVAVSFAKEPYKRDDILQKRPVIIDPTDQSHPICIYDLQHNLVINRAKHLCIYIYMYIFVIDHIYISITQLGDKSGETYMYIYRYVYI